MSKALKDELSAGHRIAAHRQRFRNNQQADSSIERPGNRLNLFQVELGGKLER